VTAAVHYAITVANKIERQQLATMNLLTGESTGGRAYEHRHIECNHSGFTAGFYSGAHNPQSAEAVSFTLRSLITAKKMECFTDVEGKRAGEQGCKQRCVEAYLCAFIAGLQYGAVNPQLAEYTYCKVARIDHPRAANHYFTLMGTGMLIKETATVTVPQLTALACIPTSSERVSILLRSVSLERCAVPRFAHCR
jgi:hypothetical protein